MSLEIRGGLLDSLDDTTVGSTPAEISLHETDDRLLTRPGILHQQAKRRHDHPRRAIAALHRPMVQKCLLERMKPSVLLQALDGADSPACDGARRSYA